MAGNPKTAEDDPPLRWARRLGAAAMGVLLGLGLLPAIFELLALSGDVTPFKYQNF